MTEETAAMQKARRDVKELKDFMNAYPFPGYPKRSTDAEQEKIDQEYFALMRRHGINPDLIASREFNELMIQDLMKIAFPDS